MRTIFLPISRFIFVFLSGMVDSYKTLFVLIILGKLADNLDIFKFLSQRSAGAQWKNYTTQYSYFEESERLRLRDQAKEMFYFGYDGYIKYAFPMDELDPIHCTGRGPDYENP